MEITIERSSAKGAVTAPPSKSYTHRALMCAALAKGKSKIISPSDCDDVEATADALSACGIGLSKRNRSIEVDGGFFCQPSREIYCRDSGTTLRFMTAFCPLAGKSKLTCGGSLSKRPIGPLLDALKELGARCRCADGYPPVEIEEKGIKGGKTTIPGDVSSQFISALLLVSPYTPRTTICLTAPLESKPYVLMTLNIQKRFGIEVRTASQKFLISEQEYSPTTIYMEGDWSSASFLLAAGALSGEVEVQNLDLSSLQADRAIIEILKRMGADIEIDQEKGSVISRKSKLKSMDADVSNSPDIFPVLCVLAANAEGITRITGIKRLRIKESDRVEMMKRGLNSMGITVIEKGGELFIEGKSSFSGTLIDPGRDHRIAMAFAVLGLAAEGKTIIKDAECTTKSFPDFWSVLKKLNCEVIKNE